MSAWEGPFPPRSAPIRVEGGIRARTARGAIGDSWWSRRFIEVLESFDLRGRLSRGRSYARQGQVLRLEIDAGEVAATVQGSRDTPYQVRIGLAPLPEAAWAAVEAALAGQAIYCARLLAGEMPHDIEDVFAAAGAPLFPQHTGDVGMRCSCPDPEVPCKHLAATFYLLAEAFDDDPFRILQWRGRGREPLLARLRELRDGTPDRGAAARASPDDAASPGDPASPDGGPPSPAGAAAALAGIAATPLDEALDRFWLPPVPLPDRRPPVLRAEPDLLLRQLPTPGPALGGADLVAAMRHAYRRFADRSPADDPPHAGGPSPVPDPGGVPPDASSSDGS